MNNHAAEQYKRAKVQTADQGKLIILLYNAAIKALKEAIISINNNNIEVSHNNIIKTQKIITELLVSLNISEGGEIAKNLQGIYVFINKQLMLANLKKDGNILNDILEMLTNLRDAFRQIIEVKKPVLVENNKSETKGINIKA